MFTFEYAKNPSYSSAEGNIIFLTVKWAEFDEEHQFSATSYDTMPHGVALYNRAKTGEFGAIAPYVATPVFEQPSTTGSQDL